LLIFEADIACEEARILLADREPLEAIELLNKVLAGCQEWGLLGRVENISNLLTRAKEGVSTSE